MASSEWVEALKAALKSQREREARKECWAAPNRAGMLQFLAGWMASRDAEASKLLEEMSALIEAEVAPLRVALDAIIEEAGPAWAWMTSRAP